MPENRVFCKNAQKKCPTFKKGWDAACKEPRPDESAVVPKDDRIITP